MLKNICDLSMSMRVAFSRRRPYPDKVGFCAFGRDVDHTADMIALDMGVSFV